MKLSDLQKYAKDNALDGYSKYRNKSDLSFIVTRSINQIFPFNDDIFYPPRKRKDEIINKSKDLKELPFYSSLDDEEVKVVRANGVFEHRDIKI